MFMGSIDIYAKKDDELYPNRHSKVTGSTIYRPFLCWEKWSKIGPKKLFFMKISTHKQIFSSFDII
jgi:hypothetical protein